jgi:hypothetical protein
MGRPITEAATYRGLMIRLPDATLQACKREAAKERRSLNAQLLCVIDEWLHETEQKRDHAFSGSAKE